VKKLVKAGKSGAEIAKEVGISLPSVQNVKKAAGAGEEDLTPASRVSVYYWALVASAGFSWPTTTTDINSTELPQCRRPERVLDGRRPIARKMPASGPRNGQ
jgi:hypothetical protein